MKPTMQNNKAKNILYILAGLGGIGLIILIHEGGHFLFAKLFNVPTPVFSLGFGPTIFAFPLGKTLFKLSLLPIGGYVEIDSALLAQQRYIPKMLIIFGGILFNLIFAYCILLYHAMRNQFSLTSVVSTITPNSPAERAGLQPTDTIIACNDQSIGSNPNLITNIIAASQGKIVVLTIERNGDTQEVPVTLDAEHPLFGENTGWLGIELEKKELAHPSLQTSLQAGHKKISATIQDMSHAVSKIMTKKDHRDVIIGPIGIISMMGKSLAINTQFYWFIIAVLSLNIGLLNILPLPFFDGGKALLVTIEAITGKVVPPTALWLISTIFLALFIFFMATVTVRDMKRVWKK